MTRFLLDVNTVLALLDPQHVFHNAAHIWAERAKSARWLTCPVVQNGVIRVASQSSYPNSLGTAAAVRSILQRFCATARHDFCPDDISLLDNSLVVRPEMLSPSRLTDLYLLALAQQHHARLATFDRRVPAEAVHAGASVMELIEA